MVANVIAKALGRLGVNDGDCVLAHTSLRSFGIKRMSPKYVIDALRMSVGINGTVVLPALSYTICNKDNRHFDYHATPTCVGAVPEYFRTSYSGVLRSMCPTHSCCAVGAKAEEIVCEHHLDDTPCGSHSPFAKVRDLGGKIIFFGCGTEPNTSMHAVEELYNPDYLFGDIYEYEMTDAEGRKYMQKCRAHNFERTVQRYDRLQQLMPEGTVHVGRIFDCETVVMDAKTVWQVAGEYYAKDSHYFVDTY